MWVHTEDSHEGVLGENRGMEGYKFVPIHEYRNNMTRQCQEGPQQLEVEKLQKQQKVKCLTKKIDYIWPFKMSFTLSHGSNN